jgi:transcriptional regulator with XRE-family HTH domain
MRKHERVREMAKAKGLSVRQLAIKAGIIPQALYGAINGRTEFWSGWKVKVADVLEVNVDDLFNEEHEADTPQTESTGSPIGDYRDGVGAWQTDCPWK